MRYAQILNNKVHWIFESSTQPQFSSDIFIVPLGNYNEVQEGWGYDPVSGGFIEPTVPGPVPEPEKDVKQMAEEIQAKQARDTIVKFDVLATVFEDLEKNDVIKFEVLATIFETLMDLQEKIDNLPGGQ